MARFTPFSYRGTPGFIEPTKETINAFEEIIRWAEEEVPFQLHTNMARLAQLMATVNQGYARKMAFGPEDPGGQRSDLAWKIPVRRISGRYYLGWKIKPVSRSGNVVAWQLYNDSREAYFIEFGINWLGGGRRVRRPIQRLSLRKTLDYMASTQAFHRIWAEIFVHRGKGFGFTQQVQSPRMGSFGGPQLGRYLP
jgi:hypothetical protein